MTVTSIILMILCLGGIWGALIYYLIRMIRTQNKTYSSSNLFPSLHECPGLHRRPGHSPFLPPQECLHFYRPAVSFSACKIAVFSFSGVDSAFTNI